MVIRDSRVDTELPKPSWAEYVGVVVAAAAASLWDRLKPLGPLLGLTPDVARTVAALFVGLVLLCVAWIAGSPLGP